MPFAVTEAPYRPVPLDTPRKRWTRVECEAMSAAGLLDLDRVELIEGDLIAKMPKKPPHFITLARVADWMRRTFGAEYVLQEVPVDVAPEDNPTSEPEPDIILLKHPYDDMRRGNAVSSALRLLVEISSTTLGLDLTRKAGLYARAGIAEYWVFDVAERRLLVHRDPQGGQYQSITAYNEQESVAPLAAPSAAFLVSTAFQS